MSDPGQEPSVRLRVPGEHRYLALVRSVVVALAEESGFQDQDVDKIEMSVDEACTNVMDHAYDHLARKPPVEVEIRVTADRFVVDVKDEGKTFDFNAYVPPKFPEHWISGHLRGVGLYLIRTFMDDAQYEKLPGNINCLRLAKNLPRVA
jgi:serine/threonine-protein kinase RsbW